MKRLVKVLKDLIAKAERRCSSSRHSSASRVPASPTATARCEGRSEPTGNWDSNRFNLPASLIERMPQIGEHDMAMVMHNDGAVGLFEVPSRGTGVGNARFTNRNGKGER